MKRSDIVAAARSWIKTPFEHQATLKGIGCDCRGMVVGVATELGISTDIPTDYGRHPSGNGVLDVCDQYMARIPVEDLRPGDVVAVTFETDPQHVAIIGDYQGGGLHGGGLSLIHSLADLGVVEQRLDSKWRARITAAYTMPGAE